MPTTITLDVTGYIILAATLFFSNFMAEVSKDVYHHFKNRTKKAMNGNHA